MPARLRTPIAMLMLGLLAEQSRHVYDMRVCLRERGHDQVVKVGRASLYDAVPRLLEAGLIRQGDTSSTDLLQHFGLLHTDYTPKPAFFAYRDLIRAIG
jgi:DNA-binding PadR family transcriptional regulator